MNFTQESYLKLPNYTVCHMNHPAGTAQGGTARTFSIKSFGHDSGHTLIYIDNIFIDRSRINSSETSPISNGLSDHEAQYLVINNFFNHTKQSLPAIITPRINEENIAEFLYKLSKENWEKYIQIE
jgi:hypothetical protein